MHVTALPPLIRALSLHVLRIMDCTMADVAAKAAATMNFHTYTDVKNHLRAMTWSGQILDFDDAENFGSIDVDEAADLGIAQEGVKRNCLQPARSYEMTRRFHIIWSVEWTSSKGVLASDGLLHQVRCLVYCGVGKKDFLMMPKRSTLVKHDLSLCHRQNLAFFAAKWPASVLQQMAGCSNLEAC